MFVNGAFNSTAYVSIEHGESDDIFFRFLPTTPGEYTCTFSFNQDGSNPLCSTVLNVNEMPAAKLDISYEVLNVTDNSRYIVTDDKFRVKLTITNTGTNLYSDDITVKMYRNLDGTYGSNAQIMNQRVILEPSETTVVQFDMDNVIDGWDFFDAIYYYNAGSQTLYTTTPYYTIVFPEEPVIPDVLLGDVDGDGSITIKDVTVLIDYLLGSRPDEFVPENADLDSNGDISIADITQLIDALLGH
jgi:hypothetical protein